MSREHGSVWARWRVAVRLARRQVWRTKGSSALVVLLVTLPVLGMSMASVFFESSTPSASQKATALLGQTNAKLWIVGGADPTRRQRSIDYPDDVEVAADADGNPTHEEGTPLSDPSSALPTGTQLIEVVDQGSVTVRTAGGVGQIAATAGPVWDDDFRGAYVRIAGTRPTSGDEAMASPGLLTRTGARIGETIELADGGRRFRITGTMRAVSEPAAAERLFVPRTAATLIGGQPTWYSPAWQPAPGDLRKLNQAGVVGYGRALLVNPPADAAGASEDSSRSRLGLTIGIGAAAAAFCGYLVVLLAGAAFAVSARRQQRTLAMTASVGAARGDVFRVVALQGTALGLIGGVLGTALGVGAAALASATTNDHVYGSFWWSDGIRVPWWEIALIFLFAVVVGTASAVLPARAATRGDVLGALRGARRPTRLDPKRPVWGIVLIVVGIGSCAAGAFTLLALNSIPDQTSQSPLRTPAQWAVIAGPILFQLGVILAGHWLLAGFSRGLARVGLPARIASRDAAAAPSRVIPAFGAIAACVFLASFAVSYTALNAQAGVEGYQWQGPMDSAGVTMYSGTPAQRDAALPKLQALVDSTSPSKTVMVRGLTDYQVEMKDDTPTLTDPSARVFRLNTKFCDQYCSSSENATTLAIVEPEELETVLGVAVPASTMAAFRDGDLLVPWTPRGSVTEGTDVWLTEWTAKDAFAAETQGGEGSPGPLRELRPRVVKADLGRISQYQAFLSPQAAEKLGVASQPQAVIATYAAPLSQTAQDRLAAGVADIPIDSTGSGASFMYERGPASQAPAYAVIIAATALLVISASAVCLGLARFERRPDDATLSAVGAERAVRRRINAWQGLIIVSIGAVTGTIAGLIPMWGIAIASSGTLLIADTPWGWLALLALGLPLLVAAAAWIVPPRHPDLTRRTAIA